MPGDTAVTAPLAARVLLPHFSALDFQELTRRTTMSVSLRFRRTTSERPTGLRPTS